MRKWIGARPGAGARAVLCSWSLLGGLAVAGLALAPAGAQARTLYRWTTDDGGIAFADDAKRIPERYRERAEQITTEGLSGYARFTPTDAAASQRYADRLAERVETLRAAAAEEAAVAAQPVAGAPAHPLEGIALQSVRQTSGRRLVQTPNGPAWRRTSSLQRVDAPVPLLGVNPDPDSDEPIIVERVRARADDSLVTRHVTVVRQGDRVLSIIKPRARQHPLDWASEEDLDAGRY